MLSSNAEGSAPKKFRLDNTCFIETTLVKSLKDPKTAREKLDKYFQSWNDMQKIISYYLPFCRDLNRESNKSEKLLYEYLMNLQEPMAIVHGYQHNTEDQRGLLIDNTGKILRTGICETVDEQVVTEIDLTLVHRVHKLLLFEVKDMQIVDVIHVQSRQLQGSDTLDVVPKKETDRCPVAMIEKAEAQLVKKQQQIEQYLKDFFTDEETKNIWRQHWNMSNNDIDEIELLINSISTNMKKQSFICLFNWNHAETSENGNLTFRCNIPDCSDKNHKADFKISKCRILLQNQLESKENFSAWWKDCMKSNETSVDVNVYEFLLNRIGLDFFLSDFIRKNVSVDVAVETIDKHTSYVREQIFHTNGEKANKKVKVLWEKMQKTILTTAELAFIIGPPGCGKTIIMIEKVKSILDKLNREDKILVLCGKNKALKNMLMNDTFNSVNPEKLLILTMSEFENWRKIEGRMTIRFEHIFVDESQDLDSRDLLSLLYNNMTVRETNRHFWVCLDVSQTHFKTIDPEVEDELIAKCIPFWDDSKLYFTTYYLKYVFRSTIRQFESFSPYLAIVSCTHCWKEKKKKNPPVCNYCRPWHGLDILGPQPLCLPVLKNERDFEDFTKAFEKPANLRDIVLCAFIKAWTVFRENITTLGNNDANDIVVDNEQLKLMINEGCLQRTAILFIWIDSGYKKILANDLQNYLVQIEPRCKVGKAKQFYLEEKINQKYFLIVDDVQHFKGLECSVAVIYIPWFQWREFSLSDGTQRTAYTIGFSRANCLNVIVTTSEAAENFDSHCLVKNFRWNARLDRSLNKPPKLELLPLDEAMPFWKVLSHFSRSTSSLSQTEDRSTALADFINEMYT